MYSDKLIEHFRNPRNMGKMEKPDGVGKAGNPVCGDVMYLYIKVKDEKIEDIKFETFGCAAAIGTSSMITEMAKGKKLEEASKITRKDVADAVGGLPPIKIHCSVLATDALRAAIEDYQKRKSK
jgi:nitrogen fixation NifU-like protein